MRDRRAKFVELAEKRVSRAISTMRLIGNLSNRSNYDFSEEEGRKIIKALQREVDALKTRFGDVGNSSETEFKL